MKIFSTVISNLMPSTTILSRVAITTSVSLISCKIADTYLLETYKDHIHQSIFIQLISIHASLCVVIFSNATFLQSITLLYHDITRLNLDTTKTYNTPNCLIYANIFI